MHKDFPKLFSEISTESSKASLRWQGIETFTGGSATKTKIEMLVRLAFATKAPASGHQSDSLAAALKQFHEAFSEADPSIESGQRQDQILAAGGLLEYLAYSPSTAMAVTTTAMGGLRKAALPIDIVNAAENAASLLGATRRKRPDLTAVKVVAPQLKFEPNFDEVAANQPSTYGKVFEQLVDAVDDVLIDLSERFNKSINAAISANKMADEELNMLAWVFGEHSLMPARRFTDVPAAEKPLVFARDLASITTILPGPNSVTALLIRAGLKSTGKIKIVDAVNAVSEHWTTSALRNVNPSPATSPIHFALLRRQETGSGDGWFAGWSAVTGIDAAAVLPPIVLAELFYRESLWLR